MSSVPGASTEAPTTTAALGRAVRNAGAVNRSEVDARAGLIAAVPVAGALSLGIAAGRPVAAVTMGVGAMLVGIAWRSAPGVVNPPLPTMTVDAFCLSLSTLVGCLTGRWPWLHLATLAGICALAGLATVLGRRGAVVGTQAMIAFIAFGRFPQPIGPAASLAGLVLLGGGMQVVCAATVASPLAFRRQRSAISGAYGALAALAHDTGADGAPATAAAALDAADATLTTPALFADPHLSTLQTLVSEGRRIRLELVVLGTRVAQLRRSAPDQLAALAGELTEIRDRIARALTTIAEAFTDDPVPATQPAPAVAARGTAERFGAWGAARDALPDGALEEHAAALTGQVGAALRHAAAAADATGRTGRLPHLQPTGGSASRILAGIVEDLGRIRGAARLSTPAGRHALRLVVVVAGTELLIQRLLLPRGYWAVIAAATVLRPDWGATYTRAAERMFGTVAGVVVATLVAVAVDPGGWGITAVVAVIAWITFTVFGASFAAGVAGLTAMVVFMLHAVAPDSAAVALDRGLDTLVGGTIGLAAYVAWPTWSSAGIPRLLGSVVDAQTEYLEPVLAEILTGVPAPDGMLRERARAARIASGDAEAAVTIARGEPHADGSGVARPAAALAALRRVVRATHALRLAADHGRGRAHPELAMLCGAVRTALEEVGAQLAPHARQQARAGEPPLPPLRALYRRVDWGSSETAPNTVRVAFDELVDAIDTAALAVGLELPTDH